MNILFIGNSYTYYNDMPALFERLAKENGLDVSVWSVTKGGRKLIEYTNCDDTVTVALNALLSERRYDAVVLQEQSLLPLRDWDLFFAGLSHVIKQADGRADRLVLYATWGRKEGSKDLSALNLTTEQMAVQLEAAYSRAAAQFNADLSPVGMNFLTVYQAHPDIELYDPDCSHPSYLGSCLSSLTHYRTIFGQLPEHMDCLSLSAAEQRAFISALAR